jgi:hypothetical protein
MIFRLNLIILAALPTASPALAQTSAPPTLVAAYTRQLAQQCGPLPPGATAPNLLEQADLNGDRQVDWIVDAGRYPCPSRPEVAAQAGTQVTVFKGEKGAGAVPAFQRAAFGSRLQRATDGSVSLVMTLGGVDCGAEDRGARCERRLVWRSDEERFEIVPATPVAAPPARTSPKPPAH